ncbi:RNA-binding S4 domain-containing protein [Demequina sp. TTPB684]|uniref:RNA-binding S4 domain-containing protein n=1 Tax=unclassified Demequina TaxID=2620311 RepID=UPI001CF37124|nr:MULTISPECIES: RNA-binding S4 domain-containing protein [unclassified Demequina]MCB2412919.1 RNA-binding S4 domain-containing protein [Demequina sp. TTPB684]UPU87856.1 RNA-binding S4 domain-containing protein [Demequina sp. TMPB413]
MVTGSVRADAWVWAVRLYKSRTQATMACRAGHVRVNGDRAKAATHVKVGDRVVVRAGGIDRVVEVRQLLAKRVGAEPAAAAYVDHTPAPPPPEFVAPPALRDRGSGRPTKKERRQLDKLRGRP